MLALESNKLPMTQQQGWILRALCYAEEARQKKHILHDSICEMYTIGKSIDTGSKSVFFRSWGEEMGNDCYWKWGFYFDENTL